MNKTTTLSQFLKNTRRRNPFTNNGVSEKRDTAPGGSYAISYSSFCNAENDGDEAFLMMVLKGFLDQAKKQIQTLREALEKGDAETVREEAHAIKGGSGILIAKTLSGVAFELETIGRSGALEGGLEVFERMERELRLLEAYSLEKGGMIS